MFPLLLSLNHNCFPFCEKYTLATLLCETSAVDTFPYCVQHLVGVQKKLLKGEGKTKTD